MLWADEASNAAAWGLAAAIALAGWIAVVAVLSVITRSRTPEPQPAGLELGGDEPPAVANLLTHDWDLEHAAVSATMVDLAARDVLVFHEPRPDRFTVRVVATPTDLTPYEQQVFDLVHDLGRDGTAVPFEALTTGESTNADKWFKRFTQSVIDDSRRRGLSQARWQPWHWILVAAVALAPALLTAAAVISIPSESDSGDEDPIGGFIGVSVIAWCVLIVMFRVIGAERDTDEGLASAGRWLGLRENLRAGAFPGLEPTAIAIWDRYLAYAVALGVAVTTARAIPLGAEDDNEAWSNVGGRWRLVRVKYRGWWPPRWGKSPASALGMGLLHLAVIAGIVYGIAQVASSFEQEITDARADNPGLELGLTVGAAVVFAVLSVTALRALIMVGLGALDVGRHRQVEGRVLRLRRREEAAYWAVDDGTTDEIRAFVGGNTGLMTQGASVRVDVSPRLGYVRSVDVVADGTAPPEEAVTTLSELLAPGSGAGAVEVLARLDAAAVAAALGVPVQAGEPKPVPGGAVAHFSGPDVHVLVTFSPQGHTLYEQTASVPGFMRRAVAGVGDEAVWIVRHSLAVRDGSSAVFVGVRAKDRDNDERRAAAVAIAREVLMSARTSSSA